MSDPNQAADRSHILREQCYICWMTPTDAPRRRAEAPTTSAPSISPICASWSAAACCSPPAPSSTRTASGTAPACCIVRAATRAEAESIAYAEPYTKAGIRTMTLTPWQRNEGALNLQIRFSDGVMQVDNRTYAIGAPAK